MVCGTKTSACAVEESLFAFRRIGTEGGSRQPHLLELHAGSCHVLAHATSILHPHSIVESGPRVLDTDREARLMRDQERLKRVLAWLDIIAAEVVELLINNYAFWQVQEVIRANKELQHAESVFFEWMVSVFAHSAAVGVRRQAALDDQSVSLHRLLVELQKYPHLVTREYHRNLFKNKSTRVQQLVYHAYDNYVGLGRTELDPARIQIDIDLLAAASKKIHHYTDRVVAHYDEKGLRQPVPTFHDLSKCLLEMEELVLKYLELVKGESKITLLPTFLYDWKSIFRTPWIVETGGSSACLT